MLCYATAHPVYDEIQRLEYAGPVSVSVVVEVGCVGGETPTVEWVGGKIWFYRRPRSPRHVDRIHCCDNYWDFWKVLGGGNRKIIERG
jgi:hypothetical protein